MLTEKQKKSLIIGKNISAIVVIIGVILIFLGLFVGLALGGFVVGTLPLLLMIFGYSSYSYRKKILDKDAKGIDQTDVYLRKTSKLTVFGLIFFTAVIVIMLISAIFS